MAIAPPKPAGGSQVGVEAPRLVLQEPPSPWPRRFAWIAGIVAVVIVGLMVLPAGFPQRLTVDMGNAFE